MELPSDYESRVYAGVLGKLIGVYLGRPFEGWTYQKIMQELGPVQYYVHENFNRPWSLLMMMSQGRLPLFARWKIMPCPRI